MKRTLTQLLNDPKAAKVVVSPKDKNGMPLSWKRVPRKGFKLSAFPKGAKIRFRVLDQNDKALGTRDVVIGQK
jgi:hypothetical protein